jgi:hydroxyacylglutathione hydrolase
MLVAGFPAGLFETNCYVLAADRGEEAIVVDPGQDALAGIDELCRSHRLRPVAAVLTHGHLDHMWSVAPLAGARGIPAWIHPDDRHLLADPLAGMGPDTRALLGSLELAEPDDVRELTDGAVLEIAGLRLAVHHTPGHTRGHVIFRVQPDAEGDAVLSGDLVFAAGAVGRTDLPGGSAVQMTASLRRFLTLPDELAVLPGHGPPTTVARERATNPFLAGLPPQPAAATSSTPGAGTTPDARARADKEIR